MEPPAPDSLPAAVDEPHDRLQRIESTKRLRTYESLLREWYVLSRQWSQIVSEGDPTAMNDAETIEHRLDDLQTEVDELVDEFAAHEFDRVMRHVLEE